MASTLTFAVPVEWSSSTAYEINTIVFVGKKAYTAMISSMICSLRCSCWNRNNERFILERNWRNFAGLERGSI